MRVLCESARNVASARAEREAFAHVFAVFAIAAMLGGCPPGMNAASPWSCYRDDHPVGAAADCTEYRSGYTAESAQAACAAVGGALSEQTDCPTEAVACCTTSFGGRVGTLFYYDDADEGDARAACELIGGIWTTDR